VENLFEMSKTVEASLERTWEAWTEGDRVSKWFSPHANIDPVVGGPYELFFDPEDHSHMSTIGCVVTLIEPMKRLHFQWKGPDQFSELMNEPPKTKVEVTFQVKSHGTLVNVKHFGWGKGEDWDEAEEWHVMAWKGVLDSLGEYMAE
jgi:uncharacterized protein YndB with AHSA1/START domain